MLTGRAPFTAATAEEMIRLQARAPVPPLTDARPDLAAWPDLVATVAWACAKNPADRPPSASTLSKLLQRSLRTGGPSPARTPAPVRAEHPPGDRAAPDARPAPPPRPAASPDGSARPGGAPPRRRDRAARIGILVAIALGLTVTGVALWLHQGRAPPATPVQAAPAR
jgi:eukaryotic-like serine/threonine-protein kinase